MTQLHKWRAREREGGREGHDETHALGRVAQGYGSSARPSKHVLRCWVHEKKL